MENKFSYRCIISNPKNVYKKCVITSYQNGKYILFNMVCHAAKMGVDVYGNMDSIINYIRKYGKMLSRLAKILCVSEEYIFANIVECLDTANRELKRGAKK